MSLITSPPDVRDVLPLTRYRSYSFGVIPHDLDQRPTMRTNKDPHPQWFLNYKTDILADPSSWHKTMREQFTEFSPRSDHIAYRINMVEVFTGIVLNRFEYGDFLEKHPNSFIISQEEYNNLVKLHGSEAIFIHYVKKLMSESARVFEMPVPRNLKFYVVQATYGERVVDVGEEVIWAIQNANERANTNFKEMIVIEGRPGIGKSTLIKALAKRFCRDLEDTAFLPEPSWLFHSSVFNPRVRSDMIEVMRFHMLQLTRNVPVVVCERDHRTVRALMVPGRSDICLIDAPHITNILHLLAERTTTMFLLLDKDQQSWIDDAAIDPASCFHRCSLVPQQCLEVATDNDWKLCCVLVEKTEIDRGQVNLQK